MFLTVLALYAAAHAQPMAVYDMESSVGTYNEITDGTVVASEDNGGKPIGFDFKFNNALMSHFIVMNGHIVLGEDENVKNVSGNDNNFIFTSDDDKNLIGVTLASSFKHLDNTEVSYKITGTAPERVLVVQYKNIGANLSRWEENYKPVQMQIRLHETTGKADIVFSGWNPGGSGMMTLWMRIGIRGTGNDMLLLQGSFDDLTPTPNSNETLAWNDDSYPADGLTCTFTPPADCEAPAAQPTELNVNGTSTMITGGFTAATGADHYLVLLSTDKELTELPADGTLYTAGQFLGNAQVLSYSDAATIETRDSLKGATEYTLFVMSANSACMFGPKYLRTSPLTATVRTAPACPQALTITDTGLNDVSLNATANAAGDNIIIGVTTEPQYNQYGQMIEGGIFGTPKGNMAVGDGIEGGGRVVYAGPAKDGTTVGGLEENTTLHFAAWSVNADGNCSTTNMMVSTTTGGTVPYVPNFGKMSPYGPPPGWDVGDNGKFSLTATGGDTVITCRLQKANIDGETNSITSPWIQLGSGTNRVIMELNMTEYVSYSNSPYNDWADGDTLRIQMSTDGQNFTDIYKIGKATAPKFETATSYATLYMPFDIYSGQKVRMRIHWTTFRKPQLNIKGIKVEEKADCDYPVNLRTVEGSIVSDKAAIDWDRQGNENAWELQWRAAGTEEWSNPEQVAAKPYTVSGLPSNQNVEVRLRAACDGTTRSEWSKPLAFLSGYGLPFTETFGFSSLPSSWSFAYGALATPTVFDEKEETAWVWSSSFYMRGLILMPNGTREYNDWVLTPKFDMGDGSVNYQITAKLSQMMEGSSTDEELRLLVSRDGGATFNTADVVATATSADIDGGKAILTATLREYSGTVRAAVMVHSSNGEPAYWKLEELSVTETCPSDITDIVTSDTTDTSVKVSWNTAAETSYVFIRKAGETVKPYTSTVERTMTFDNLEPRTDYEIGITKMCEPGDTAKVTIIKVTTLTEEGCPEVENITVTPDKYEAAVQWTGEGMAYNVRYRKTADTEWTIVQTTETKVTLTGLEQDTEYTYGIQTMCSMLADDVSDWTADATFRTLPETCFVPTEVSVSPSYNSATVTYSGESDSYEIQYAAEGNEEYTTVTSATNSCVISGLQPETTYRLRLRGVCSETDRSPWTAETTFTTTVLPECVTPTGLSVSEITAASARLSWTADAGNLRWNVRYRKGTDVTWTTADGITATSHELTGLDENSSYVWSVMAVCEAQDSKWASQNKFSTAATAIGGVSLDDMKVFVSNRMLNIVNPSSGFINGVTLYSPDGRVIRTYAVNASDNVFIPLGGISETVILVRISGKGDAMTVRIAL